MKVEVQWWKFAKIAFVALVVLAMLGGALLGIESADRAAQVKIADATLFHLFVVVWLANILGG